MTAPVPVYRDPVWDGATDPTVVTSAEGWWMFYTQRRATHSDPGPGVAWVHGTRVGVARSVDGESWEYVGVLNEDDAQGGVEVADLVLSPVGRDMTDTHWAPEVVYDGTRWWMFLTSIAGVPHRWEGHARHIVSYTSTDLRRWRRHDVLPLASDRVIDAAVRRCPDGLWRLWYKDEAAGSTTAVAASPDLDSWRLEGTAVAGRAHEGPFVFALGGRWWMLTDEWRGMAVHRSDDAKQWERVGGPDAVILGEADPARGLQVGRHGCVVIEGDRAWLYYFTHPGWDGSEIADARDDEDVRRSAVFRAELSVDGDVLRCRR